MKIIPAILPTSFRAIDSAVEAVCSAVDTVQIDIVDGHFANNKTWLFNGKDEDVLDAIKREERGMPQWENMNYELDLMIRDPLEHIETIVALGPSKIIFHVESFADTHAQEKLVAFFESMPHIMKDTISFGMAIGIETDVSLIEPFFPHITTVQCMGILNVGFQFQPFDERVIDQITKVQALYPDMIISVDGGVTFETAPTLLKAGASELVVGSVVFQSHDPHGTIQMLKRLATHHDSL